MQKKANRKPTQEQLNLISRFLEAFNEIESYLRNYLDVDNFVSFTHMVSEYAKKNPAWRSEDSLRMVVDLRNALVHESRGLDEYLSVPLPHIVNLIEQIRDDFLFPKCVIPMYKRDVVKFYIDDPLAEILLAIKENNFSQFPIYQEGKFLGLITENGITRWLANYKGEAYPYIDLADVYASDILNKEEERVNYHFLSRNATVLDAENEFLKNKLLEACLITEHGAETSGLLGIITRWDILHS